jgi:hypothetical protein
MTRYRALLASLAVIAVLPAASAHAASPSKHSCTAKGAKTVVKNRTTRVFTTPGRPGEDTIDRLFGCLYSNGKRILLTESRDDDYVSSELFSQVTLTGRFVAWQYKTEDFSCKADCPPGYDPTHESVVLVDLRARKRKSTPGEARPGTLAISRGGTATWLDATTGEVRSAALR